MRLILPATLATVALVTQQPGRAQSSQTANPADSRRISVAATTQSAVAESNATIARMQQAGELTSVGTQDDREIPGRQSQTLQQMYKGIPVEGGSVSLQKAGPATISAFGTLFTGVSVDTTPAIAPIDAARIIEKEANAFIAFGATPTLVIVPSPAGTFALTYKATVTGAITYYVDAFTGDVLRAVDDKNYDTGIGTGTLGEPKKMATTVIGGTYRTKDALRPAGISTFDTGGSAAVLSRMENGNLATDNDLATSTTNTWTNGYYVDAHSNTGLTYDYFFRQHNWSGLDNKNRPMSAIVHSGLVNNAYFISPPFGPNGNGEIVFGRSTSNMPVASMDTAGHELMHGVTSFALSARTGSPAFAPIVYTVLGPTSFTYNGSTFPCSTTVLTFSNGVSRPFFCNNGRYVLGANHGGALNEGISDVFGTSVEFFNQPVGSGPLKADYLIGEDITGFGPIRSLNDPASISIRHDFGTIGYPDHLSKMLNYALIVTGGTAANPTFVDFSPAAFSNGNFVFFFTSGSTDGGGVHLNSTLFSHAFYLAVEGGRNATSGVSVTGVGAANRAQIEKVFFRATTQLMPNDASLTTAAAVVIQAAIDLYGAGSAPAQAVTQAMTAVGLR